MNRHLFRRLLSQPVANKGSELRDHQANERTFLSWNRFGLAFAAMSLALARLDIIDNIFNRKHREETAAASKASLETKSEGTLSNRQTENTPILLEIYTFLYFEFNVHNPRNKNERLRYETIRLYAALHIVNCFAGYDTSTLPTAYVTGELKQGSKLWVYLMNNIKEDLLRESELVLL
ncbi:hypothetical protein ACN38_g9539 [Penicillium nordicum]|uniref:DUF202 domain-containing protein n=1 Tax=Penicillium nordicum TaxID=229535 RepID=A0A0M8NY37_9EURO|nr:hypothetical protein ACN38_g9539 [Penicillium nordicum]